MEFLTYIEELKLPCVVYLQAEARSRGRVSEGSDPAHRWLRVNILRLEHYIFLKSQA